MVKNIAKILENICLSCSSVGSCWCYNWDLLHCEQQWIQVRRIIWLIIQTSYHLYIMFGPKKLWSLKRWLSLYSTK
uniref:Uncharacterized protein n=1 Tax=Ciona intestinalis TaxID=7719 RepID=F7AL69_CIOIN